MSKGNTAHYRVAFLILLTLIMVACQTTGAPEEVKETPVTTQVVEATQVEAVQEATPTPVEVVQEVTPTLETTEPRTLIICMGGEPDTLYMSGLVWSDNILEAIYDGPIDSNSFAYQPVILEKLPSLADGDAMLTSVKVKEGDAVVDANGEVVELGSATDILLVPAGGGETVTYEGGDFEMNQLSATFHLLPDLKWSDGTPLTAADSVYAFNIAADPDTLGFTFIIERTTSYEARDDLTIVWTGLPGYLDPDYYTNFFEPAPEHIWGQFTAAELIEAEESNRAPIGWGPYVIEEWVQGDRITLRKNPNYFRANEGLPKFDTLIYRFVGTDTNANIVALLSGECDILALLTGLDDEIERVLELHSSGLVNATFTTGTAWGFMPFGIQTDEYDDGYTEGVDRPDFFSDVRTRMAFAMCTDRQALVNTITYGQSSVIDTYLPHQHPLYNPAVVHYDFDVSAGSALLEDIGWLDDDGDPATPRVARGVEGVPDGTKLEVTIEGTSVSLIQQIVDIIQGSLDICGIQANIQLYPASEWYADGPEGKFFGRRFDLGIIGWWTGVAPPCDLFMSDETPGPEGETWISIQDGQERNFFSGWRGLNNSGFANEEYDAACNSAFNSLPGQPEYKAAHLEAQKIFAEQLPGVPLYQAVKLAATRPDMCGFIVDPTANSEFWNIEEFDFGEGCED